MQQIALCLLNFLSICLLHFYFSLLLHGYFELDPSVTTSGLLDTFLAILSLKRQRCLTKGLFQFINVKGVLSVFFEKVKKDADHMLSDRLKWNRKYETDRLSDAPSLAVKRFFKLAGGKKALDIAAGNGRNAIFLAEQGFAVDAVDISDAALNLFGTKHTNVQPICADLDNFDIAPNEYDLIINIKYLNRRLFPYIREGLNRGGILIFQTFLDSPDTEEERPLCRDYRLRENELLHAFLSLKILFYAEDKQESHDDATHLATLVAVKMN